MIFAVSAETTAGASARRRRLRVICIAKAPPVNGTATHPPQPPARAATTRVPRPAAERRPVQHAVPVTAITYQASDIRLASTSEAVIGRADLAGTLGYAALSEAERGAVAAQSMAAEMAQVQKMSADPWIRVETRTSDSGDLVTLPDNMFALMVPSFTVMFAFFVVGMMAAELLKEKFARIEDALAGPYFAGEKFSIVDAVFAPVFRYFDVFDRILDLVVLDGLPKVQAWRKALAARPSVANAVVPDFKELLRNFLRRQKGYIATRMA